MRNNILTFCLLGLICFSLTSCIKKEPLNSEADIEQCSLPEGTLKSDPLITNNTVQLMLLPGSAEITALAPEFTLQRSNRHQEPHAISQLHKPIQLPLKTANGLKFIRFLYHKPIFRPSTISNIGGPINSKRHMSCYPAAMSKISGVQEMQATLLLQAALQNLMISRLSPLQTPIRENMLPNWSLVLPASGVH